MNKLMLEQIKVLKKKYNKEGFIIIGVFGSYARNEETGKSDIDILYELTNDFRNKFSGFSAAYRIETIKNELKKFLGKDIDIANRNAIGDIGKKYILPETFYV